MKSKRKIFKVSRSHVVTLPPEWVRQLKTNEVFVVADSFLLIVPKEREKELEKAVEAAITTFLQEVR